MISSLTEANKSIDQAYKFYYKYIKTMQEQHGNIELCKLLGKSDKYVFKVLKRGNTMAMKRLANEIEAVICKEGK